MRNQIEWENTTMKKKAIFFICCFALGLFFLFPFQKSGMGKKIQNEIMGEVHQETEKTRVSSVAVKEKKAVADTIGTLPDFIKRDLQQAGIDSEHLDEIKWNAFLASVVQKGIENISFRSGRSKKNSILHLLASMKSVDVKLMEELIGKGLDINQKNDEGVTPLLLAIKNSNVFTLKKLIELGGDLHVANQYGFDPLSYALMNENNRSKRALIDFLIHEKGMLLSPEKHLYQASRKGNKEYLLPLISQIPKNEMEESCLITMRFDAMDDEILEEYQKNGLEIDKMDRAGLIWSFAANANLSNEKLQSIIDENDLDLNGVEAERGDGQSPLMLAIALRNYDKIEFFLKNGADVSYRDYKGNDVYYYLKHGFVRDTVENEQKILKLLKKYEENA